MRGRAAKARPGEMSKPLATEPPGTPSLAPAPSPHVPIGHAKLHSQSDVISADTFTGRPKRDDQTPRLLIGNVFRYYIRCRAAVPRWGASVFITFLIIIFHIIVNLRSSESFIAL